MAKYVFIDYFKVLVVVVLCAIAGQCVAQTKSTEGKEFYVSFLSSVFWFGINNDDMVDDKLVISLIVSSQKSTTGKVFNPNTGWELSFSVSANKLTTIPIPLAQAYSNLSETISKKGLIVTTSDTVSLYAANYYPQSFDITNVLPSSTLTDEYIIQSYNAKLNGSVFLILATENNTIIDVMPKIKTHENKAAGVNFFIELNKGETYQVFSNNEVGDFSGTFIKARDCKKIAVFNGNPSTSVFSNQSCGASDHLFEQAIPTKYFGKQFVVTASLTKKYDIVRVTAQKNNTKIVKNGNEIAQINARETYDFELLSTDSACYLETSEPCTVYEYITGFDCGGVSKGDPAMIWVSPIEQKIKKITFATFATAFTKDHFVNIVTSSKGVSSMMLDNKSISDKFSLINSAKDLFFARISISHGSHTLKNDDGFIAHVYGLGDAESYGYSVGSSMTNLNHKMFVNDVQSDLIPSGKRYCFSDSIRFKSEIAESYDKVHWDFGDGKTAIGDSVSHEYDTSGVFTVRMVISKSNSACSGSQNDTVLTLVRISKSVKKLLDSVCTNNSVKIKNAVFWTIRDNVSDYIKQSAVYNSELQTVDGDCFSLDTANLRSLGSPNSNFDYRIDLTASSVTFTNRSSEVVLHEGRFSYQLHNNYKWQFDKNEPTVDKGRDSSSFSQTFTPGAHVVTLWTTNSSGCIDSISKTVEISELSELAIPSAFSPNGDGINDLFHIEGVFYDNVTFLVFDRWGKVVFESHDISSCWDGTHNGTKLEPATFNYTFEAKSLRDNKTVFCKGNILLLR